MIGIVVALLVWAMSGTFALAARSSRRAGTFGVAGVVVGSVLAAVPVIMTLAGHAPTPMRQAWSVPYGSLSLGLDGLSAFFMVPLLALAGLCAIFGQKYLAHEEHPTGAAWFFYNLLVACMALVLTARNGILFLVAWEGMAVASYFLVVFHDDRAEVRKAGWIYLVATHLGSVFLLPMFILLGQASRSLDFDRVIAAGAPAPALASIVFVLAVLGFGSKAGFVPFHGWLPEAHPAAPSHVSALLSGIMIELGIYGLLRVLTMLGHPPAWWGWSLATIGLASALFGVLMALVQRDLKRLLAYSSVENLGIVAMGLGVGLLGLATGREEQTVLGFAAALLHVLNHAAFKGLLFLGAGSVQQATGTHRLDRLGGLMKTMPRTGAVFLIGAAALAGLPPLGGFVGEFTLFLAALDGGISASRGDAAPLLAIVAGLVLCGGIALAALSRAFGLVFLGVPRTDAGLDARDPGPAMGWPMAALATLCVVMGLAAPLLAAGIGPMIAQITGLPTGITRAALAVLGHSLIGIDAAFCLLASAIGSLWFLRRRLLARHPAVTAPTWNCGYLTPGPKMQYTAESFAMPLAEVFKVAVRRRVKVSGLETLFPVQAIAVVSTEDVFSGVLFGRAYNRLRRAVGRLRLLQGGNLQLYVLYIALTLLVLLVWKLGI